MHAALVLCCVVVGDKQAWCDVLWGRIHEGHGGCGGAWCVEGVVFANVRRGT
ncbi:hypothetical protein [Bartonella sp. MM73XJBT]|uniref:hypothetical protein n=1 Tax=Bartonella sp. MM73XJBT TaxID=3019095 RepID=UPI00235E9D68|nr:hypothetical protein [Bartonella sp. MM73XJBT]